MSLVDSSKYSLMMTFNHKQFEEQIKTLFSPLFRLYLTKYFILISYSSNVPGYKTILLVEIHFLSVIITVMCYTTQKQSHSLLLSDS